MGRSGARRAPALGAAVPRVSGSLPQSWYQAGRTPSGKALYARPTSVRSSRTPTSFLRPSICSSRAPARAAEEAPRPAIEKAPGGQRVRLPRTLERAATRRSRSSRPPSAPQAAEAGKLDLGPPFGDQEICRVIQVLSCLYEK